MFSTYGEYAVEQLQHVENRLLKSIFGNTIGRGVFGGRRQCHNEQLHISCSLSNIRMIRSRRATWADCITTRRDEKAIRYFWPENLIANGNVEEADLKER
jgi:hypothetical protein